MQLILLLKKIKRLFVNTINFLIAKFYILPKIPTVVVCMDGGLCSQISEYVLGEFFRNNGFDVLYDLNWFEDDGLDVLRTNKRFFEINRLYPQLKINKASKKLIDAFKLRCRTKETNLMKVVQTKRNYYIVKAQPLYIDEKIKNEIFHKNFDNPQIPDNEYTINWLKQINKVKESCALHIRRGDLAVDNIAMRSGYGHVCNDSYIFSAMKIISELKSNVEFFIFSDEMEYVKANIVPQCKKNNYIIHLVSDEKLANTEGGGVNDLYLISNCKNSIATLGSFGYVGAQIQKSPDKILITLSNEVEDFSKYVILDINGNLINTSIEEVKSICKD